MIPVVWLEAHPLCWDQHIVDEFTAGPEYVHQVGFTDDLTGAVVVVPARGYADQADWLRNALAPLKWAVVLLTSDEEALFPWQALLADNTRVWVQTPRGEKHGGHDRFFPLGAPPGVREAVADLGYAHRLDWFFAGQITHRRRQECVASLRDMHGDGKLVETAGFTQGLDRGDYLKLMGTAKVIPCPSGPVTPETFRLYEALEAGALPIADAIAPSGVTDFWPMATPGAPFPVIEDWSHLAEVTAEAVRQWPVPATRAGAWWLRHKRDLRRRLLADVHAVSQTDTTTEQITVLIPTSPIPSHPNTKVIEQTIDSVRYHLPNADVLVLCDGVREAQADYRDAYEGYLYRLTQLCQRRWERVTPLLFEACTHQADMTREAMNHVDTPLVLFVEHDTPLVIDEPIQWEPLVAALIDDQAHVIRFHHEALVLEPHEHLMLDAKAQDVFGAPMRRTVQWSQRPHLATASYYRWMLRRHFQPGARTMIEDVMHGVVQRDWHEYGPAGWDLHRLWLYAPEGNMKRSFHTDGRAGDVKFGQG